MYPANLTGYSGGYKHIRKGFFVLIGKNGQPGLWGRRIKAESDHLESLENLILKEGIEDVEAKAKCQGVPDSQRLPKTIWTYLDQGSRRCSSAFILVLGIWPLCQGIRTFALWSGAWTLSNSGSAPVQKWPAILHGARTWTTTSRPREGLWRSFGLSHSKAALVTASEQVAKSVVGFAALASLILLFFETQNSRKCSVYRYIF